MSKKPYYITTAIAYTSGKPHIGNTYEIILADAIARFKREEGFDVFFQTGTDEHGQKIELKAKEEGIETQKFVDRNAEKIREIWDLMDTSYDNFVRTTDENHKKQVQKIFKKLYDQGDIYKGFYEGLYCTPCESFFTETQLVNGKCPDCQREVSKEKEEVYFFNMSKYANRLIDYIKNNDDFIKPESRKNEMMNNFLLPGLKDLSVSRTSFNWGIPVSFDEKHVTYVWLDALSNYITGIGYDADGNHSEEFKKLWPANLHLIGKDIIRFHTIYWPIFLMALGLELPKQIFGHPWLLQGDGKMSKSKGNVLYADDLASLFGVDAVRYFVLHEMPFDNDGVISFELMIERYNSELANVLGNLVSRTISMTNKYFEGSIKNKKIKFSEDDEKLDFELRKYIKDCVEKAREKMEELRVADAITEIFNIFKRSNKYIDETCPWILAKEEDKKERLEKVLYNLLEAINIGASILESFLPSTSKEILSLIGTKKRNFEDINKFEYLDEINVEKEAKILFARIDKDKFMKEIEEKFNKVEEKEEILDKKEIEIENKENIDFETFLKLQLNIGEIIKCEEVEKSKKLLVSQVKIGNTTRQIVSGIKKWYKKEEMIGKKVVVLTNLEKKKIAGLMSEGMILCAEDDNEELSILTVEKNIKDGSTVS